MRAKQRDLDLDRDIYELVHPKDLSEASVHDFMRSIGNTLRTRLGLLNGLPTVGFEVWSRAKGFSHRVLIPSVESEYITGQLETHIHGVDITPVTELEVDDERMQPVEFTFGVELYMSDPLRKLRISNSEAHAKKILEAMRSDEPNEIVLFQWLISHSGESKDTKISTRPSFLKALFTGAEVKPEEAADRKAKASEQQFAAAGRIAAVAEDEARAKQLIMKLLRALQSENSDNRILAREIPRKHLYEAMNNGRTPWQFGNQLTVSELTSVMGWPIGDPQIPGLRQGSARRFPATDAIAQEGRVFGTSDAARRKRPIALDYKHAAKHQIVVGASGSGKSVALSNWAVQDAQQGYGVIVIDAGADISRQRLFYRVLDSLPPERVNDVICVNPTDRADYAVSINLLDQGFGLAVIDQIVGVFESLYPSIKEGVSVRELLHHGLWTLIEHGGYTLIDLASLLSPRNETELAWATQLIRGVQDPELKDFWDRNKGATTPLGHRDRTEWDRYVQPLHRRLWQLAGRPEIRNIIGQTKTTLNLRDVLKENKILLVSLGGMPEDSAELLGTLITNTLWAAAQTTPVEKDNYMYLDEFQITGRVQGGLADLLARARAHKLGLVLGTQFISARSISPEVRDGVLQNAGTKIVFKSAANEAGLWSQQFGSRIVHDSDITKLQSYHGMAQIANQVGDSTPVTFKALKPPEPTGIEQQALRGTRTTYGRPVSQIRSEIVNRRKPSSEPSRDLPSVDF